MPQPTQAERLMQRSLVRVSLKLQELSEQTFRTLDALSDDSIVGDAERGSLIDACATLQRVAMRAAYTAQQKSASERGPLELIERN